MFAVLPLNNLDNNFSREYQGSGLPRLRIFSRIVFGDKTETIKALDSIVSGKDVSRLGMVLKRLWSPEPRSSPENRFMKVV